MTWHNSLIWRFISDGSDYDGLVHTHWNDTFFIYAVASNAQADCNLHAPAVYTRIDDDMIDWIEDIISWFV